MNLFSFIKQNLSILTVVGEYATLKKAGLYYKGVCPFHQEKTASFTVSPHKEIFYCFGCHSGGDVISFIEKVENCSALEAAEFLAERYQLTIPEELKSLQHQEGPKDAPDKKKRYHKLCSLVAQWCHENLLKSPVILRYFSQRSINQKTIESFKLGYFPSGQPALKSLIAFVGKEHFLVEDLLQANILAQGKSVLYSPFEDRVFFPIQDHLGRFCGFGGRIFKKDDERPKYYNSKENDFFAKGSLLFGLDRAKVPIQHEGTVFLVEGYTDCLAMVQEGFENTVATLGTACTQEHLKLLSRYAQKLFILYDSDKAGIQAVLRLTELCWLVDLELSVIELPRGEDPASFIEKQGDLALLIKQAKDIFMFWLESMAHDFKQKSLQEKVGIVRSLLETIQKIADPLKQELLLSKAAQSLDVPFGTLKKELYRLKKPSAEISKKAPLNEVSPEESSSVTILKEIPLLEKKLFSVIINNMELLQPADREYLVEYLSSPLKDVLKKTESPDRDSPFDFMQFFDFLHEPEKRLISNLILECQEYENSENLDYLLAEFQKRTWKNFVADTKKKLELAQQKGDLESIQKQLEHFKQLKEKLIGKGLI
ncbi:MAG: DNA primase [Candidatus Babeliales bacterium]